MHFFQNSRSSTTSALPSPNSAKSQPHLSLSLSAKMQGFSVAGILFLCLILAGKSDAHNITRILAKFKEFSTFNHYLSLTHLAPEINRRETITVLAIDNAAMSNLLSKGLPINTIKNVLSLHILLDYFGAKKLHQITNGTALAATMYQATGSAPGTSGFVNITDLKGGKVGIGAEENDSLEATFVKSLAEIPYNISVIQISHVLNSPSAEAPTPAPSQLNLTALMSKQGCKTFADLLIATTAEKTYEDNVNGGLTVFCPTDGVFVKFMPKYKNLTADEKMSLLLYHGIPIYQSIPMLKSNNGPMNTLATDGLKKYQFTVQNNGEVVTLMTKRVTASITGTLLDEQPVAIFTIDKVLQPKELFAATPTPAPAPAPARKKSKSPSPSADYSSPPEPEGPDAAPADKAADDNSGGVRFSGQWGGVVLVVGLVLGVVV